VTCTIIVCIYEHLLPLPRSRPAGAVRQPPLGSEPRKRRPGAAAAQPSQGLAPRLAAWLVACGAVLALMARCNAAQLHALRAISLLAVAALPLLASAGWPCWRAALVCGATHGGGTAATFDCLSTSPGSAAYASSLRLMYVHAVFEGTSRPPQATPHGIEEHETFLQLALQAVCLAPLRQMGFVRLLLRLVSPDPSRVCVAVLASPAHVQLPWSVHAACTQPPLLHALLRLHVCHPVPFPFTRAACKSSLRSV
jgi:hypothetical protein